MMNHNLRAIYWDNATAMPLDTSVEKLLYAIRQGDNGLILDACGFDDIYEDSDGILGLDAMVTPYVYLERKMEAMSRILNRYGQSLKPVAMAISQPFAGNGTVNIAVKFDLSDGQTITVFFHNPDTTPKKLAPTDEMISWKWLINKKDVTIVVAPEKGLDLDPKQVCARLMRLAEKNSPAFQRANAKIAERATLKQGLLDEIVVLEGELVTVQGELEAARVKAEERAAVTNENVNEETAKAAFANYEDALSKVQKGSSDKAKGKELTVAKKAFEKAKEELNKYGQWMLDKANGVLLEVKNAVHLPAGYETRFSDSSKREFIAGDIRTPHDISLFIRKTGADTGDDNQFTVEVRVFTNRPNAIVFLKEGNQFSGKGVDIKVFSGNGTASAKTYDELAPIIISALNNAIDSIKPQQEANEQQVKPVPTDVDTEQRSKELIDALHKLKWGVINAEGTKYFSNVGIIFSMGFSKNNGYYFRLMDAMQNTLTRISVDSNEPPEQVAQRVDTEASKQAQIIKLTQETNEQTNQQTEVTAETEETGSEVGDDAMTVIAKNINATPLTETIKRKAIRYLRENETSLNIKAISKKSQETIFESIKSAYLSEIRAVNPLVKQSGLSYVFVGDDSNRVEFGVGKVNGTYKMLFEEMINGQSSNMFDSATSTINDLKSYNFELPFDLDVKKFVANVVKPIIDEFLSRSSQAGAVSDDSDKDYAAIISAEKIDELSKPLFEQLGESADQSKTFTFSFQQDKGLNLVLEARKSNALTDVGEALKVSVSDIQGDGKSFYLNVTKHKNKYQNLVDGDVLKRIAVTFDGSENGFTDALSNSLADVDKTLGLTSGKQGGSSEAENATEQSSVLPKGLTELNGGVVATIEPEITVLVPEGKDNEVKTAKGTKVVTGFTVVEASRLIISHDEQGNANPLYPHEMQPRDRTRDTSQAQISRIAKNLDPDMLGRTRVAYQGAPIVGKDGVVESGNGRAMAITLSYKLGKADEYRDWLLDIADMYGLNPEKIKHMKRPVLVRVRKTEVDRVKFAMEANQSDMLAMTATEKAKSDANRLNDALISKLSIDGDLTAAANRDFIMGFLQSLGDDETAGLLTTSGQPAKQLYDRAQAAIFAKAYNDDRLLELMADDSKPEIGNIIKSLNQAARPFIRARAISDKATHDATQKIGDAIELSLDQQAVDAIVKATEMLKKAKDSGMPIEELVKQGDMFGDTDPVVAQMALFIKNNNRSAARMGMAFEAMAEFVLAELESRQNNSLFVDEPEIGMVDVLKAANAKLQKQYGDEVKAIGGSGGFIDLFTETRGQSRDRESFLIERLKKALFDGDLKSAIYGLNELSKAELFTTLLKNGFAMSRSSTVDEIMKFAQDDLIEAAKLKTDGYGLSEARDRERRVNEKIEAENNQASATNSIIELTGKELGDFPDTEEGKKALRTAAIDYFDKALIGSGVLNIALDKLIEFDDEGRNKVKSFSSDPRKLHLVSALRSIVADGKPAPISPMQPHDNAAKKGVKLVHVLKTPVKLDGEAITVRFLVYEREDGHLFYDHSVDNSEVDAVLGGSGGIMDSAGAADLNLSVLLPNEPSSGQHCISSVGDVDNEFNLDSANLEGASTGTKLVVNQFKEGDHVVNIDNNHDMTVTHQKGYKVYMLGSNAWVHANKLKLANGKKPDTVVLDMLLLDTAALDSSTGGRRVFNLFIEGEEPEYVDEVDEEEGTEQSEAFKKAIEETLPVVDPVIEETMPSIADTKTQPISTGNTEIDDQKLKLQKLVDRQARMKAVNKILKNKKLDEAGQKEALIAAGFSAEVAMIGRPDFMGRVGYADYELTNNNAVIRNTQKRILELEARDMAASKVESGDRETSYDFEGGSIDLDYSDERLRVNFDSKPDSVMIARLKQNGFKWSPTNTAWQRQLTDNAISTANYLFGTEIQSAASVMRQEANAPRVGIQENPATHKVGAKIWYKGDEVTITTKPYNLYGGEFQDAITDTGKTVSISTPRDEDKQVKAYQDKWHEQQEAFSRLHRAQNQFGLPVNESSDADNKIAAFTAELDALESETDIESFDKKLDEIVARIEAAGMMEVMDEKLNTTADVLTFLLAEAEKAA